MEAKKPYEAIPIGMVSKYLDTKESWIEAQQGADASNDWHEPPIGMDFLARLLRMAAIHESAIDFKARLVTVGYRPHQTNKLYVKPLQPGDSTATVKKYWEKMYEFYSFFPLNDFYSFMHDFFTFGNSYLERINSKRGGKTAGLRRRNGRWFETQEWPLVTDPEKGQGICPRDR